MKCYDCNKEKQGFTHRFERRAGWHPYVEICEECAESLPDGYFAVDEDSYGSVNAYAGQDGCRPLGDVLESMERILRDEGKNGIKNYKLYRVPGKYTFHSLIDKKKFGQRTHYSVAIDGKINADKA